MEALADMVRRPGASGKVIHGPSTGSVVTHFNIPPNEILNELVVTHNSPASNGRHGSNDSSGGINSLNNNSISQDSKELQSRRRRRAPTTERNIGEHECEVCHKRFRQIGHLTNHLRLHTGERPFECNICHKRFTQAGHLVSHVRSHTNSRPYECQFCHKRFTQSGHLTNHERLHVGEKPYQCKVCFKNFTQSGHLVNHMRLHDGQKPFQCPICHKKFTQSGHLHNHVKLHEGGKTHQCEFCNKKFTQAGHLVDHIRTHTNERPFECSVCGKAFAQNSHLTAHMRTHRNIVLDPPVSSALSALTASPVMATATAPTPQLSSAQQSHPMGSSMASIASVAGLGPVGGAGSPASAMGTMTGTSPSMYPSASAPHLLQLTTATAAAMAALQAARPLIVRVKRDETNNSTDASPYGVSNAMAMAMGVGSMHTTHNDVLTEVDLEDDTQPGEVAEDMRLVQPSTSTGPTDSTIKSEPVGASAVSVGASRPSSLEGSTNAGGGGTAATGSGSASNRSPGGCLEENNSKFEIGEDVAFVASVMQHAQEVASLGELGKATDPVRLFSIQTMIDGEEIGTRDG